MTTTATEAATSTRDEVATEAAALDRYVGFYSRAPGPGVTAITRRDTKLIMNPIGQPSLELEQTGEADFLLSKFDVVLCFEQIEEGSTQQLVIWQRGAAFTFRRTDAETAKIINQSISDRIKNRVPMAGSEQALRHLLDGGRSGNANFDLMSPEFAHIARLQLAQWQILGQYFGAIVSMEFLRVSEQGWDIYEVQHENDVQQYRIVLGRDGKVYGFSEASATAEKHALF